jgi:hypothetical protein
MGSLAAGWGEKGKRPLWYDISGRFPEPRHCLASFLALEGAEVLAGVKPANLVNLPNRVRPCGRNLYTLWKGEGRGLLEESGLAARELVDRGDSLLLLLYSPAAIEALLRGPAAGAVLRRTGYDSLPDADATLEHLASRFIGGFPHEIGAFLGYPLKDVAAFMGWVSLPFACQTLWKVYGDPRQSLRLAETFLCCRQQMARRLACCDDPLACLAPRCERSALFLSPPIEKDNQNQVSPCASH